MGNEGACLIKLQRGWEDNKTREQGEGMIVKMQRRNLEDDGNSGTDNHNDEDNEGPGPENNNNDEGTKGEP